MDRKQRTAEIQAAAGYRGKPFPQTHPDRLATVARLHGLKATPPSRCRVLELGCGDGANLIPMASELSGSDFIGIDLDAERIAGGSRFCAELGLGNVKLEARDISDVGEEYGKFDYIIGHGVYCWVPPQVRDRLLEVCASLLNEHGVAFISLNALPGWHLLSYLRDFTLFVADRVGGELSPEQTLKQIRALAQLFAKEQPQTGTQPQLLKELFTRLATTSDYLLAFDYLGETSDPVALGTFSDHAKRHGLEYFSDANYFETEWRQLPRVVRAATGKLVETTRHREQLADFFTARLFRRALLCHSTTPLSVPGREQLADFHVLSNPKPVGAVRESDDTAASFEMLHGARITVTSATVKTALLALRDAWPQSIPFDVLVAATQSRLSVAALDSTQLRQVLTAAIWDLFQAGALDLRSEQANCSAAPGPRPHTSALARKQLEHGDQVTNQHHDFTVLGDAFSRELFLLLDGTRDVDQLARELGPLALAGKLAPVSSTATRQVLTQEISQRLAVWAQHALLTPAPS